MPGILQKAGFLALRKNEVLLSCFSIISEMGKDIGGSPILMECPFRIVVVDSVKRY